MTTRHLLSFLFILSFYNMLQAQKLSPAEPQLRARLMKYTADNHLRGQNMYIYWDSVSKQPVRFQAGSFLVENISEPKLLHISGKAGVQTDNLGGTPNFHLVRDLNTASQSSLDVYNQYLFNNRPSYAVLKNVAYFAADDGIHGPALWRSDGTEAGTYLFKDVNSDNVDYNPYTIYASSSLLYFCVYNSAIRSYQILASDGTGSNLVSLFPADTRLDFPAGSFCEVNGTVYFTTGTSASSKLWRTDGTLTGTYLVNDFTATNQLGFFNLTAFNGVLYFSSYNNTAGGQLFRSDGTTNGTYLVKSFTSFTPQNIPFRLTVLNNKLYFTVADSTNKQTLWVSDGTATGTSYVPGYNNVTLNQSAYFLYQPPFVISNHVLYFSGFTPDAGWELYKYDENLGEGITLVEDILSGPDGYGILDQQLTEVNGSVYFGYTGAAGGRHLYKTNGTGATTVSLKDFPDTSNFDYLYSANGKLYFTVYEQNTNAEPWTSDGTAEGTVRLADIYPGSVGSLPRFFTSVNGKVIFAASDDTHGNELFSTTGNGAQLVKDINTTTTSSSFYNMTAYGDGILATAYTYDKGSELYKATSTEVTLIKDLLVGQPGSNPQFLTPKNNIVYFAASSNNYNDAASVYKTDGTAGGTIKLATKENGSIWGLTVTDNGNILYMFYNYTINKFELWKTDSNGVNNTLLGTFADFSFDYNYSKQALAPFTTIGNTVYFGAGASAASYQIELYKTDGTPEGTGLVKDIYPGDGSSYPTQLTVLHNEIIFSAFDGIEYAVWKSDGTASGTIKLSNVSASYLTTSGNYVYFNGYNAVSGTELWKTDGTPQGTLLVKDIIAGSKGSSPNNITDVNGTLFFSAIAENNSNQLWKSDGSSEGTQLVSSLAGSPASFTSVSSRLIFTANYRLMSSDGTTSGTGFVNDDVINGVTVYGITANDSKIFLSGYTYQYGTELYEGDASQIILPVTITSFTASLKNADVITEWQTASEVNTSYFNLQRSTDGIHFTTIATTTAKGRSTYSQTDVNVVNLVSVKTLYYRLQIIDKDGSSSLSKVVPVNLSSKDVVVFLLPNPVKDVLKIRVNSYTGKAVINVFDASGKRVYSTQQTVQSGNDFTINTSALQSGVYMVKINLDGKIIQQKFIKE